MILDQLEDLRRFAHELSFSMRELQAKVGAAHSLKGFGVYMGIVLLNCCQYGVLYLGSYYNTGPYIDFPHFGNSNLGKLPYG